MTANEQAERIHDLLQRAERLRVPGHRHSVEMFLGEVGEIRVGLSRLYRDLTSREVARPNPSKRPSVASFPAGPISGTRAVVQHRARPRRVAAGA